MSDSVKASCDCSAACAARTSVMSTALPAKPLMRPFSSTGTKATSNQRPGPVGSSSLAWARRTRTSGPAENSACTWALVSADTTPCRGCPMSESSERWVSGSRRRLMKLRRPCVSVRKSSSCTLRKITLSSCSRRATAACASSRSARTVSSRRRLREATQALPRMTSKVMPPAASRPAVCRHQTCSAVSRPISASTTSGRERSTRKAPICSPWRMPSPRQLRCSMRGRKLRNGGRLDKSCPGESADDDVAANTAPE